MSEVLSERPDAASGPIDLAELTIADVQAGFRGGAFTSESLTQACLDRIDLYNARYRALITMNHDALSDAREIDRRRARGDLFVRTVRAVRSSGPLRAGPRRRAVFRSPAAGGIGVGGTVGRFALGGMADGLGRRRALLVMFLGMALAMLVWALSTSLWTLASFALAYGVFYGGFVAVLPALVMDYFGGRNVSAIIGVLYTSVAFGTLIGPCAAGFAFDAGHSYTAPILAGVVANLLAAVVMEVTSREGVVIA